MASTAAARSSKASKAAAYLRLERIYIDLAGLLYDRAFPTRAPSYAAARRAMQPALRLAKGYCRRRLRLYGAAADVLRKS
jgi:hypothetical protein